MDKVYKVKEVAEKLRTHPIIVYKLIKEGKLEAIRIGKLKGFRVSEEALDNFMKKNVIKIEK